MSTIQPSGSYTPPVNYPTFNTNNFQSTSSSGVTLQFLEQNYTNNAILFTLLGNKLSIDGIIPMTGTLQSESIVPVNDSSNLGSESMPFDNIFVNTLYANSEVITQYETAIDSLFELNTGNSVANTGLIIDVNDTTENTNVATIQITSNVITITIGIGGLFDEGQSITITSLSNDSLSDLNNTNFAITEIGGGGSIIMGNYTHADVPLTTTTGTVSRVQFQFLGYDPNSQILKYITGFDIKPLSTDTLGVSNGIVSVAEILTDLIDSNATSNIQIGGDNASSISLHAQTTYLDHNVYQMIVYIDKANAVTLDETSLLGLNQGNYYYDPYLTLSNVAMSGAYDYDTFTIPYTGGYTFDIANISCGGGSGDRIITITDLSATIVFQQLYNNNSGCGNAPLPIFISNTYCIQGYTVQFMSNENNSLPYPSSVTDMSEVNFATKVTIMLVA